MDIIQGPVTNVIDGDTFEMKVTQVGSKNQYAYNSLERVRIANMDAPELNSRGGVRTRSLLSQQLFGRQVRCLVQSRDAFGRVVAEIKPI